MGPARPAFKLLNSPLQAISSRGLMLRSSRQRGRRGARPRVWDLGFVEPVGAMVGDDERFHFDSWSIDATERRGAPAIVMALVYAAPRMRSDRAASVRPGQSSEPTRT